MRVFTFKSQLNFSNRTSVLLAGALDHHAASFKRTLSDLYCQSTCLLYVCLCVCLSANLMLNKYRLSRKLRLKGSCPTGRIGLGYESTCGASIGDVIDNVMLLYDVILMRSQYSKSTHSETRTRIN